MEREKPAWNNELEPVNETQDPGEPETFDDPSDEEAMEAFRNAFYRRRRLRILLGIAMVVALAYALK